MNSVEEALAAGFSQSWVCSLWGVSDDRVHRWRARLRESGTLIDKAPGGNPTHGLLGWEERAILELAETWGEVDRSHRKLAHRGSYTETVWVSPSPRFAEFSQLTASSSPRSAPVSPSAAARGPTGSSGRRIASGAGT